MMPGKPKFQFRCVACGYPFVGNPTAGREFVSDCPKCESQTRVSFGEKVVTGRV